MHIIKLTQEIEIHTLSDEIVFLEDGNKRSMKLENQLMRILLLLVKHEGELVHKDTFINEIWEGNKLVGAKALTKNIFKLRELCKKNGIEQDIRIETIPKKGYRLIVRRRRSTKRSNSKFKYAYLVAAILLLALVGLHYFPQDKRVTKPQLLTYDETNTDTIIFLEESHAVRVIDLDTTNNQFIELEEAN